MSGAGGIGGTPSTPDKVAGTGHVGGPTHAGEAAPSSEGHGPTLNTLKHQFIKDYGEEDGTKLFNRFMAGLAMQIISQVQHSQQKAQQAARQMRQRIQ